MTKISEHNEIYGELLSFLTIYLVELSTSQDVDISPSQTPFSPKITGRIISHTGLSNWGCSAEC